MTHILALGISRYCAAAAFAVISLSAAFAACPDKPVIIDNKPGAGTIIGSDALAKSAPDGYTLVVATFAHAVNPSLMAKLPFDSDKAFAPAGTPQELEAFVKALLATSCQLG